MQTAAADLASIRRHLLTAQVGHPIDASLVSQLLRRVRDEREDLAHLVHDLETALRDGIRNTPADANSALDKLSGLEAALFDIPIPSAEAARFVDTSFQNLVESAMSVGEEVDQETLEIFRAEAADLLHNIDAALKKLAADASDQNAVWELRRNAHTFKGASGIIGLNNASAIAHRMESLLDKIVEMRLPLLQEVRTYLERSAQCIERAVLSGESSSTAPSASDEREYRSLIDKLSQRTSADRMARSDKAEASPNVRSDRERPVSTPIVRVSLERLDELIQLSQELSLSSALVTHGLSMSHGFSADPLNELIGAQRRLIDELHAKLVRVRMVRFVTLETRLARAVHVTALDTGKKVSLNVENGEVEVDTQIIDVLIEPLLHLLKNSVVHGIESPEIRRLIGKPETGTITVSVECDENQALILTVSDDGSGISASKLKEKAVAAGEITTEEAGALTDIEAMRLIYRRGLTTAGTLDLNAGRGVGMCIVKEAIEAKGGAILMRSAPEQGTTFTILLPLVRRRPPQKKVEDGGAKTPPIPLVLVVDDSTSVREQTERLIREAGYSAITANNGAEALELLLGGFEPDLILSDVEMPHINGWEFLEYVKTDANFGHIPIVMVTSLDAGHRDLALSLGAADLLCKPFTSENLQHAMAQHISPVVA